MLYDVITISKKHDVIYVGDEEETLILEEESQSKMLAKQNDPILKEKTINISPINYSELNKLSKDFGKRFVPQKQLSIEQAFWLPLSNPKSKQLVVPHTPVEIEVVKERTTPSTITEDACGFEQTKKVFLEEVIPFINSLRASFKDFNNGLHSELNEVKTVFNQMEAVIEQCSVDKEYFDIQKKKKILDNDRLLERIICQDVMTIMKNTDVVSVTVFHVNTNKYIVHICVNSLATRNNCREMQQSFIHKYIENLVLKAELANKKEHMIEKKFFNEVVLRCSQLENWCANHELKLQHQKESEFFKISEWQAKLNVKDVSIAKLKKHIESLKGKNVVEKDVPLNNPNVIALGMFKIYLEPLSPKLLKNKDAYIDYIKHT
ncbi:hypothetical protein Tco_1181264 [Tanacetum coccineum]